MKNSHRHSHTSKPSSISEDEIKRKLYGDIAPEDASAEDASEERHEAPVKKERPAHERPIEKEQQAAPEKDLFAPRAALDSGIQAEIDTLKKAIVQLEQKLRTSESRNQRLKTRLVQKRALVNFQHRFADLIFNRMPEKFLIILTVVIAVILLVVIATFRPRNPVSSVPEKVPAEATETVPVPVSSAVRESAAEPSQPVAGPENKRYTIQIAEFADGDAAKRFIQQLQSQGFTVFAETIYRGENRDRPYYKINVGAFDTYNEAKEYNERVREKAGIEDSFIKQRKE